MRLLTPPGPAGIAILRAVGAEALRVGACLRDQAGRPAAPSPQAPPRRCRLVVDGQVLDEVLAVDRGDDGLELHTHGSPAVVAAVLRHFPPAPGIEAPLCPAQRLLREALAPEQVALALEQQGFDLPAHLARIAALPKAAAAAAWAELRQRSHHAMAQVTPCRLRLVGRQNAGKSTLFNRLLHRPRALAGPLPGLTRDPVRETVCLAGYPYELIDTAGLGPPASAADARAQALGRQLGADAVMASLLVVDGARGPDALDRELAAEALAVVATRADQPAAPWPDGVPCHLRLDCRDPGAAGAIRAAMGELLRQRRALAPAGPVGGPAALDARGAGMVAAVRR